MEARPDDIFRARRQCRFERFRIGQQKALLAGERGVVAGKSNISLVLPTRYGKTDVIRMLAGLLIDSGHACCSLVLSPNTFLRDQVTKRDKIREMMERYEPCFADRFKVLTIGNKIHNPNANGEWLLSGNIQLIQRNVDIFGAWVESQVHATGKPVLAFIDEAHTGSVTNKWGDVPRILVARGAVVILLTATPERSKGDLIYGFPYETLSEEECTRLVPRPGPTPDEITVEVYEGSKRQIRLLPDYEYRLRDAWEEDPLPIAKLEWLPFSVNVREHTSGAHELLSDLSPTEVRGILGRIVRDPLVIEKGVRLVVAKLRELKAKDNRISVIVFCGNDREDDPEFNAHAKLIMAIFKSIAPDLKVIISTSSEEESDVALQEFCDGEGDVAIVKQRASAGLDSDRLKIALDLSSVRTRTAFYQRMMRIATIYKNFYGILIAPDEPIGAALFHTIVSMQGGEVTITDIEKVREYTIPRSDAPKKFYTVEGTDAADFADSDQNWADKDLLVKVEAFRRTFPEVVGIISHASLAARIEGCHLELRTPDPVAARDYDTKTEIFLLRSSISQKMRDVVKIDLARKRIPYSPEIFGATSQQWYGRLYRLAGVSFCSLDKQTDLAILKRLVGAANQILAQINLENPDLEDQGS